MEGLVSLVLLFGLCFAVERGGARTARPRSGDAAHEGPLARRLNARWIPSWRGLFRRLLLAASSTDRPGRAVSRKVAMRRQSARRLALDRIRSTLSSPAPATEAFSHRGLARREIATCGAL